MFLEVISNFLFTYDHVIYFSILMILKIGQVMRLKNDFFSCIIYSCLIDVITNDKC